MVDSLVYVRDPPHKSIKMYSTQNILDRCLFSLKSLKVFIYLFINFTSQCSNKFSTFSWRKLPLDIDVPLSSQSAAIKVLEIDSLLDTTREVVISYTAYLLTSPLRMETCGLHLEL